MRHALLLVALLLITASPMAAATVEVRSPSAVTCVAPATGETFRANAGRITWDERVHPQLQCTGENLEPRDLIATDTRADFFPAIPITLIGVTSDITITWLDVTDTPRVLAVRQWPKATSLSIPVARKRGRWLRISRKGASPVTMRVPDDADAILDVPAPVRGGELFGRLSPRRIQPIAIVTREGNEGTVGDGFFTIRGVPSGSTLLRARYAGGFEQSSSRTVRVTNEESTWVPLPDLPRAGALAISIEPSVCIEKSSITLLIHGRRVLSRAVDAKSCRAEIEGVPPVSITAQLLDEDSRLLGTANTTIAPDEIASLLLGANIPIVHGFISIGGEPAPRERIRFTSENGAGIDVAAEDDGAYSVRLPHPGKWSIQSYVAPQISMRSALTADFHAGEQEFDIDLAAGVLRITVEAEDKAISHAQLLVKGPTILSSFTSVSEPLVLRGLPIGTYALDANVPGKGSAQASVTLTEDNPAQDVTLTLRVDPLSIVIRSFSGAPIFGARVTAQGRTMQSSHDGTVSATDLPDGTSLRVVAAGYEPTCALVQRPSTVVTLRTRGAFEAKVLASDGMFVGALTRDGAPCTLQLADLTWQRTDDGVVIRELNAGAYTLTVAGKTLRFVVPGEPVTLP
ncbi:MAG: carboxypeptidase-like regulatory domain-containing protein [Thermoanaerobaculia bacterium]